MVELPSQPKLEADGDAVEVYPYGGHHLAYQAYRNRTVAGSTPALPTTTYSKPSNYAKSGTNKTAYLNTNNTSLLKTSFFLKFSHANC